VERFGISVETENYPGDEYPLPDDDDQGSDASTGVRLGRDRPLSFRWKADYEALARILDLPRCKSRRSERALASIVYDAALSASEDPAQRISYSRRKAYYAAAHSYYGTDYGYDTVVPAIDALIDAGFLVDHNKVKGRPGGTGTQSSFRPAPQLAEIMLPVAEYRAGELIRLKDADGNLIGYRDTERTQRDRRFMEAVNRHIAEADLSISHINGVVVNEAAQTIFFPGFLQGFEDGMGDHTVFTRMIELYRVYKGGWSLGGRLYGGWWQQVRAIDRPHLLIDGSETVESDYSMLHPRLVYALAGQRPDGDAYTLDGWNRSTCKRAFNILLNTNNYRQALGAVRPHVGGSHHRAAKLIADLIQRHSPIADSFHSGAGLRLQNTDSEMAKSVLRELTLRDGITVLPIHDSFIVKKEHEDRLEVAMDKAFFEVRSTVGDNSRISILYRDIHPHMPEVSLGEREGGTPWATNPTSESESALDTAILVEPQVAESDTAQTESRPPLLMTGRAEENLIEPGTEIFLQEDDTREASEPARLATPSALMAADKVKRNKAMKQDDKAVQSTCGISEPDTAQACQPKTVQPPAFLKRVNWSQAAATDLHRLADKPLKEGRTIDRLATRKRRQNDT